MAEENKENGLENFIYDLELAEAYRDYPCLYNKTLEIYKNRNVKNRAYQEIATRFNTSAGKSY